jgi:hypothetical protein
MRPGASPLGDQILTDLLFPPIGACVWWVMARGWAKAIQGENVSEGTKKRQKWGFWMAMGLIYLLMFGVTIYGLLTG